MGVQAGGVQPLRHNSKVHTRSLDPRPINPAHEAPADYPDALKKCTRPLAGKWKHRVQSNELKFDYYIILFPKWLGNKILIARQLLQSCSNNTATANCFNSILLISPINKQNAKRTSEFSACAFVPWSISLSWVLHCGTLMESRQLLYAHCRGKIDRLFWVFTGRKKA